MNKALELYKVKKETIAMNDIIVNRAKEVQKLGLKPMDSLHFAFAEHRHVNVLLTVDDAFINSSKRINSLLNVQNPIIWFMKEIEND